MNVSTAFVAHSQATVLMQPTQGSFNDPAMNSRATAMFCVALGQHRFDLATSQLATVRLGVVRPIALRFFRTAPRLAGLTGDGGYRINQRQQLCHVVAIGGRDARDQRNAVRIRCDMVFRACLAAIRGGSVQFGPSKTARTEAESTTARDQSIWSAACKCSSRIRWSLSQMPKRCHSASRRQHVMSQPHPISCGNISHGMPIISTYRIPVSVWRCPIGFRPGCRRRRGFGGGKCGSINVHNRSSKICLAMSYLLVRPRP